MTNKTGVPKRELELTELLHEVVDEALREHRELVRLRAEKLGGCLIDGLNDRLNDRLNERLNDGLNEEPIRWEVCADCEVKV